MPRMVELTRAASSSMMNSKPSPLTSFTLPSGRNALSVAIPESCARLEVSRRIYKGEYDVLLARIPTKLLGKGREGFDRRREDSCLIRCVASPSPAEDISSWG
jgi:hypothetical protein